MVDGNVERSLSSYVANNNGSFNSFFKKQLGAIYSSVPFLRISNMELKTPI